MEQSRLAKTGKVTQVQSKIKNIRINFFDIKGSVHKEFVLACQAVTSA
jgi:hypothetical protein